MASVEKSSVDKRPGTGTPVGEQSGRTSARSRPAPDGHLPISELAYDRPAAPSPFGDDVEFPMPVEELRYRAS